MYLWKLLDKLKDYKLTQVAGFEGLNRNIRWFHIAEDETLSNFIIGDELVFTTGVKMNGNSVALLGFVKAMLKYGAGGIVINTGKYINEIPQKLKDFCNENRLPLFVMPWEIRLVDVGKASSTAILEDERFSVNFRNAVNTALFLPELSKDSLSLFSEYGFSEEMNYTVLVISSKNEEIVFGVSQMSMLKRYGLDGILYISVEYDSMFETFKQTLQNNYGIVIFDEKGNAVYEKAFFDKKYREYELNAAQLLDQKKNQENEYTILSETSSATGWTACLYKPNSLIVWSVTPITRIALIAVFIMTLMSVIAMMILTSFVTKRIRRLRSGMKEVEQGNFEVNITSDSRDEIGDLVNGFDSMLLQLNTLIKEVYEGRIKEKEYEMKALQAQINPHFLYNTLSLINWKAIEADAEDISKITLALSTFYRTSLNKGKNVMSLSDELRNMRSYLDIQLMMHDYEFDVEFDVDESIGQYQSLNLMLQPLIENAIAHGIDVKTDGRGKLTITGKEDGDLIVLTVADNGVGMSDEQAARILTEESKGYGVRNVNERIKLYYGEQYSLQIESKIGQGTKASIRIPKRIS